MKGLVDIEGGSSTNQDSHVGQDSLADERPGPVPTRVVWRGRKTVAGLAMVAILIAAVLSHSQTFEGIVIAGLGIVTLAWALTRSDRELHRSLRATRGPGWWLGWLVSKVPGRGATAIFSLLCLGVIALGVAAILTAR